MAEITPHRLYALLIAAALFVASCGGSDTTASANTPGTTEAPAAADAPAGEAPGVRLVSAATGAAIQADPPADLVILDVRTEEEFAEAHLDGAIMIDFYREDFADQLTNLDRDVPYLLYCRSGNRSGQTAMLMSELGFTDVADVDGGILAWTEGGFATTGG